MGDGDGDAGGAEPGDLAVVEVDAVGEPDIVGQPARPLEELDRPAAMGVAAIGDLVRRLPEMGVAAHAVAAGQGLGPREQIGPWR